MNIILFSLLGAATVLTVIRLVLGPSLPDRVVALDLLGMLVAGTILLHAWASDQSGLLDVVLSFTLVAFFGTVAIGRYLERRISDDD